LTTIARIAARTEQRPHRAVFEGAFGGSSSSVIVEVELADGRVGYGEATLLPFWSGESPRASLLLLEQILRPALEGVEAGAAAAAARTALAANNFLIWAVEAAALDALEIAATPRPVAVRGLIGRLGADTAAELARVQIAEGHRRLKVKLTGNRAEDEARLHAVRDAAPTAVIVADANEAISWEDLPSYAPLFRETSVAGVEQPCARLVVLERGLPDAEGWAWVADESIWGYEDALALGDGPWHAWTLHPGKCRGEDILRQVAEVADGHGIAVVLGSNAEFGPGAAALCRIATTLPESELQKTLGHDLAGPLLVESWSVDGLTLGGGAIHPREEEVA
jgi:L-alanine-DL-glutamate epimerase-like enolase superfamily enzyme